MIAPAADSAAFVGLHYLYPLIAVSIFGTLSITGRQDGSARTDRTSVLISIGCYAIVIYAYFVFKLWIPHLRPVSYDARLWAVDVRFHRIVEVCMAIRSGLSAVIPYESNAYLVVYIAAFYVGLAAQARMAPGHFRELVVACMVMQIIGTLGYLAFPALGPFVYEAGVNPVVSAQQAGMRDFYQDSIAFGPAWLRAHGGLAFTAGLAAMPSLHVSGMTLFFLNARRRTPPLAPFFGVLLVYVGISSVANRWHYLLDVPAGVLVAAASLWLARKLVAPAISTSPPYPAVFFPRKWLSGFAPL